MQHWHWLFCFFHFDAVVWMSYLREVAIISLTAWKTKQTHVTSFVIVLNGTEAALPKFVLLYYFFEVAQVWTRSVTQGSVLKS